MQSNNPKTKATKQSYQQQKQMLLKSFVINLIIALAAVGGLVWFIQANQNQTPPQKPLETVVSKVEEETKKAQAQAQKKAALELTPKLLARQQELKIEVIKDSDQNLKIEAGDNVEMHYNGMLENGTKFDSSYDRGQTFGVTNVGSGQVIEGWDIALINMKKGAKYKVTIPPALAYKDKEQSSIPANSTLVFDMEVVDIIKP
jgi:FK506-binding protein 2